MCSMFNSFGRSRSRKQTNGQSRVDVDVAGMRLEFDLAIALLIRKKRNDNKFFFNNEEYHERIEQIKQSKITLATAGKKKCTKDYRNVRKYDVIVVDGKDVLVKAVTNATERGRRYYVRNEELFDIIHSTHMAIDHGGRDRMITQLKYSYVNVTKETVMIYLSMCAECNKRLSKPKTAVQSKHILHTAYGSRAMLDIIEMQSACESDFRYIMSYQDYSTKFFALRPLRNKCAREVALHLVDIFTTFGAQDIVITDESKAFIDNILDELDGMWDDMEIVHGIPLPSLSQGTGERTSKALIVKNMLALWVIENKHKDWSLGLKFIQFQVNCAFHPGIKKSPYEAMFGFPPRKKDMASICVPIDKNYLDEDSSQTEEDIETILQVDEGQTNQPVSDSSDNEQSKTKNHVNDEPTSSQNSELVDQPQQRISNKRQIPIKCSGEPAKEMMKRSRPDTKTLVQKNIL